MNKKILTALALAAMTGLASAQIYTTNLVPGGGYESSDSTYAEITANTFTWGGGFTANFPTSGGNPDGYMRFSYASGGADWSGGVSVIGNVSLYIPVSSLGLSIGITNICLVDMKTESGAASGLFYIEYWNAGGVISVGADKSLASPSTSWQTLSFPFVIPSGTTGLKFVCKAPANATASTVSFDNVRVVAVSLPVSAQITSPANGATVFTNFAISASASVAPGSITHVEFYSGTTLLGNVTTAPFVFSVLGATPGAAALTAVAYDSNGNSATSSVVNVTIDTTVTQTAVAVGPNAKWQGFMNVYETPQNFGGYLWGAAWGIDDLSAKFSVAGTDTVLTLKPTPQGDTNSYWYDYTDLSYPVGTNGAVGFKDMAAQMYVELTNGMGGVNGNLVTFSGTVISNTLVSPSSTNLIGNGWTSVAFIRDYAPNYSSFVETNIALTNGAAFSLSLLTNPDPNRHVQYGFITRGPNVWPTDVNNYGSVVIQSASASTTNVYVNSSATWSGHMNVYETPQNGGGYLWGSGWGTADLKAAFDSFGLTLSPNNIGDASTYWYVGGGAPGAVGNKIMEASMLVAAGSLPGQNVVFSGTMLSNTLVSASNTNAAGNGWTCVAYIRDFAPDYSSFRETTVPLTNGLFSLSMVTVGDAARHVEYGFHTKGPDVWVTDSAAFGNVVIQDANALTPTITPSRSGGNINLSFPTQLGHNYTVQYKNNLTDASWSTLTATNGTGVNAVVPDSTGNGHRFYRLSVQ